MDPKTLVNILVEIAELEELQVQAQQTIVRNERKDHDLAELQAEYEADAQAAAAEAGTRGRDFRTINREVKETEARLADRRDRLIGVSDRRQHRALTEEISSLENRLERLEEEAILILEAEETDTEAAEAVRQESREMEARAQAEHEAMGAESRTMADRLANIELDLNRLVGMLPEAEKRHVTRLRGKLDRSVVFQHNGACRGCFNQLPVQEAINVDRGRTLVRCPSCLRYIVHRPWK